MRRLLLLVLATVFLVVPCALADAPKVDLSLPQALPQALPKSLPPGSIVPPSPRKVFGLPGPSPVIFPEQKLPLRFSHAQHLRMGKDCLFCHEKAATSVSAKDRLLPDQEVCETCHNVDEDEPFKQTKVPASCVTCHPSAPKGPGKGVPEGEGTEEARKAMIKAAIEKVDLPPPNLKFNHQIHIKQQIPCGKCHGDLTQVELATRAQLPRMSLCLTCHNDGFGSARTEGGKKHTASPRCGTCHLLTRDGTVQVNYASGVLVPSGNMRGDAHGLDFRKDHKTVARAEEAYCQSCHRKEWCQTCHNGVVKPMDFHGNDYVSRHPLDARRNDPNCGSCHRRQTFCMGCHERLGVVDGRTLAGNPPSSGFWPSSPRRFHPEGWASPAPGPAHHAWEAQRNIRTCVSCHREDSCMQCHTALPGGRMTGMGSAGVNPHPLGFADSQRCQALADRNPRMCLKCHQAGSQQLRCGK